jgi:hypothetical protein
MTDERKISDDALELLRAAREQARASQMTYEFVSGVIMQKYGIPGNGSVNLASGLITIPEPEGEQS